MPQMYFLEADDGGDDDSSLENLDGDENEATENR